MKEKVQAAIEKIRPMLKADGGDVELIGVSRRRCGSGPPAGRLLGLPHVPDDVEKRH